MRYLIIEYESDVSNLKMVCDVRSLIEENYEGRVSFIGNYPDRITAQTCSVIRERLINVSHSNSKST